jgi:hypothetical protein
MWHASRHQDLVAFGGWLLWFLCIILLYRSTRHWLLRGGEGQHMPLTGMAVGQVAFGLAFLLFATAVGLPRGLKAVATASIVGALPALITGWKQSRAWEVGLRSGGQPGVRPNEIVWPSSRVTKRQNMLLLAVLIVVTSASSYLAAPLVDWWVYTATPPLLALCGGYFFTRGSYAWFWAKREERKRSAPIIIRLARPGG